MSSSWQTQGYEVFQQDKSYLDEFNHMMAKWVSRFSTLQLFHIFKRPTWHRYQRTNRKNGKQLPPVKGGGFFQSLFETMGHIADTVKVITETVLKIVVHWVMRLIVTIFAFVFDVIIIIHCIKLGAGALVGMFTAGVKRDWFLCCLKKKPFVFAV